MTRRGRGAQPAPPHRYGDQGRGAGSHPHPHPHGPAHTPRTAHTLNQQHTPRTTTCNITTVTTHHTQKVKT